MPEIKNEIRKILLGNYGIAAAGIERVKVGVINTNYIIRAAGREYLFKIYNLHNQKEVRFELDILEFLAGRDFPCPRIEKDNKGRHFFLHSGKPVVLLGFIPGRMAFDLTPAIMRAVGVLAGRLHRLLKVFPQPIKIRTWEPADIGRLIKRESGNIIKKKYPDAEGFVKYIADEYGAMKFSGALPAGMTHQDVKPENIIIDDKGKISFIDFNNCYRGVLIYDLMTTVIWSCFRDGILDEDLFAAYIGGYAESRPLTRIERGKCFDALRFRLLRETFVWPMRFTPAVAREKGESFLRAYRGLVEGEERYRELIKSIFE